MSGYNIECFLYDFSCRTNKNLDIIYGIKEGTFRKEELEKLRRNSRANYEVTQLINSLLGLIVIPVEASKKLEKDCEMDFFSISKEDSNSILNLIDKCKKEKRYYSTYINDNADNNNKIFYFMKHIRNSLSHGGNNGLHFYPIEEGKNVTDIIFYDTYNKSEFCIKLSIDEVKVLEQNINNLLCGFEEREKNASKKIDEYQTRIMELEEKMKNYKP